MRLFEFGMAAGLAVVGRAYGAEPPTYISTSAAAISKTPREFVGDRVSVSSEVDTVLSPQLFTLQRGAAPNGMDVVVLTALPRSVSAVRPGDLVTVPGPVRTFGGRGILDAYPWLKIPDRILFAVQGLPVIVADSVLTADGRDLVAPGPERADGKVPARTGADEETPSPTPSSPLPTPPVRPSGQVTPHSAPSPVP